MKNAIHQRLKDASVDIPSHIMEILGITGNGLSEEQVIMYRERYGSNRQANKSGNTVSHCVRRAFVNPFSIILFVLAMISVVTEILLPGAYGHGLSTVIILSMLLLSGSVRLIQELSGKKALDELIEIVSTTATVVRGGVWQEIASEELVVGDIIKLSAGDRIPADCRLFWVQDFFVSQSVITGESEILEKDIAQLSDMPETISGYKNSVFRGCAVTGGKAKAIVLAVGNDTVYGGLSGEMTDRKQSFDKGANSIARVLIRFMAILVPIVFLACGLSKGSWLAAFLFALSVAVGLTPELLPMVVNACLVKGSFSMGKKQTIVKNVNAMQAFGSMDILCMDKTGTLTGDTVLLEYYMDILGNESGQVLEAAYLNSYYHSGVSNHLDSAILKCKEMPEKEDYFAKLPETHPKLDELSFDYNRKYVCVLVYGQGFQRESIGYSHKNTILIKGSVRDVVSKCKYIDYRGSVTEIEEKDRHSVELIVDELLEDGMKVLAVAYKLTEKTIIDEEENDFVLIGYLAFFDAPKQSAASAVEKLHDLKVDVRVLTGDESKTTISVCKRLGIHTDQILTGDEIEIFSEDELLLKVEQTNIYTELSPKQKEKIIRILQENGHTVGFLGDGMNDIAAELVADVGISVDTGAEAVRECADVILLKKDLNVLTEGIIEGRKAFVNMNKYIKITASSNFGNILAVVVASILFPFLPMTAVQLLLLNLLYDILCLVLPWDQVDEEMLQSPSKWSGMKLGRFMVGFGIISSIFDVVTFLFLYFYLCPYVCGGSFWALDNAGQAGFVSLFQTGWFLESMWTQVMILHLLRTKKLPFIGSRPATVVLFVTITGIVLFSVVTITPIGAVIGLVSMPLYYYGYLVLNVILYLLSVTIGKVLYIKRYGDLL